MISVYLRTDTEEVLIEACPWLRVINTDTNEEEWLLASDEWVFDPIGAVEIEKGEYTLEGEEIVPSVLDHRFHANFKCNPEILSSIPSDFIVYPTNPVRVWG